MECVVYVTENCTAAQSVHIVAHTAGFLSYALLWVTIMWGMMLGRGWAMTRIKHSTLYATHMTLALTGMSLGWVHAVVQLANPVGTVRMLDVFVPFSNPIDPIGIGVGVVGIELMTALLLSMPLQRKLGYHRWRALHSLAYAAFTLVAGHILISGSHVGPLFIKIPVIGMWLTTVVLWFSVSNWAQGRRKSMTDKAGSRLRAQQAEVQVDPNKCARFGFCEQEAPAIFELRSDGRLGYRSTVPPENIESVVRAVKVCPARAIKLNRASSRVYMPQNTSEDAPKDGSKEREPAGSGRRGEPGGSGRRREPAGSGRRGESASSGRRGESAAPGRRSESAAPGRLSESAARSRAKEGLANVTGLHRRGGGA